MSPRAYYSEIDPYAAQWLRNLIAAGEIPVGDVDERDIRDVRPDELFEYTQCHFFAGIGGWSRALRLAGWPDDRPVWTGSCPCQPFSPAGRGDGFDDPRHLWPYWEWIIRQCRPTVIIGEQTSSPLGRLWLDVVSNNLEASGYAVGPAAFGAAGVGAPHIRERQWFVAEFVGNGNRKRRKGLLGAESPRPDEASGAPGSVGDGGSQGLQKRVGDRRIQHQTMGALEGQAAQRSSPIGGLGNSDGEGFKSGPRRGAGAEDRQEANRLQHIERFGAVGKLANGERRSTERHGHEMAGAAKENKGGEKKRERIRVDVGDGGQFSLLADSDGSRHAGTVEESEIEARDEARLRVSGESSRPSGLEHVGRPGPVNGFWEDADWIFCNDEKWRAVEPGTQPLDHGVRNRVAQLRAYGNAIVPEAAEKFIRAYMERTDDENNQDDERGSEMV